MWKRCVSCYNSIICGLLWFPPDYGWAVLFITHCPFKYHYNIVSFSSPSQQTNLQIGWMGKESWLNVVVHYVSLMTPWQGNHYNDVIMGTIVSQITSLTIVYSTVYSDADQRKHQSSASLAFVRGIHWGAVNSLHKWPVTRKVFPFDDVIMIFHITGYFQNRFLSLRAIISWLNFFC